jgi:hypothetical protein
MYVRTYVCIMCVFMYVYVSMYMCVYVCLCVCVPIYIYRYLAYFVFLVLVSYVIQGVCLIVTLNKAGLSCRNTLCSGLSRDICRA